MFRKIATMGASLVRASFDHSTGRGVEPSSSTKQPPAREVFQSSFVGLILLVVLADFLFWGYRPGVSLGLFAVAVFAVAALRKKSGRRVIKPALLMVFSTLPILEHVQALSVGILMIGGLCSIAWLYASQNRGVGWIISGAVKLAAFLPLGGIKACLTALRNLRARSGLVGGHHGIGSKAFWLRWSLPIGGSLILGSLLLSANPVLETAVLKIFQFDLDIANTAPRNMLWGGICLLIWPLLNPPAPQSPISVSLPRTNMKFGLNGASVLRSLIVFNIILGVQSMLDISILLGNGALPEGMTYATYAHRGAYPLMVTAVLAGIFAVASRPYLQEHNALQPLLILWVGQNIMLSFSAMLRLDLYIGEYGLTYLRTYASIWIGLVGVGLVVVLWHVWRERPSVLLVARLAAMGFGTLYLSAFINFAGIIASTTLARGTETESVDWLYLCQLGPTAERAVVQGLMADPTLRPPLGFRNCFAGGFRNFNWRETDFRRVRSNVSLSDMSGSNAAVSPFR